MGTTGGQMTRFLLDDGDRSRARSADDGYFKSGAVMTGCVVFAYCVHYALVMLQVMFKGASIKATDADSKAKALNGEERFMRVIRNDIETVPFAFMMFGISWMAVPVDKASAISTLTLAYTVVRFIYVVCCVTVGLPARMFAWLAGNAIVVCSGLYALAVVSSDAAAGSAAYAVVPVVSIIVAVATLCFIKDFDTGTHDAAEWTRAQSSAGDDDNRVYKSGGG